MTLLQRHGQLLNPTQPHSSPSFLSPSPALPPPPSSSQPVKTTVAILKTPSIHPPTSPPRLTGAVQEPSGAVNNTTHLHTTSTTSLPMATRTTYTRHSPLTIPEILQGICLYLDTQALVRASRVSRQFHGCCTPFLWTTIPERAWQNAYFCSTWTLYGSRIRTMSCGPGVDLETVARHCHALVSLDVSRIREPIFFADQGRIGSDKCAQAGTGSTKSVYCGSNGNNNNNNNTGIMGMSKPICNTDHSTTDRSSIASVQYRSFLDLSASLIRLLARNRNLQCLQLKPQGRFPPELIKALADLDHLKILSLNGWQDFQEYSLQMIMEACPRLYHLSLGENDFTRFTLETWAGSQTFSNANSLAVKQDLLGHSSSWVDLPTSGESGPRSNRRAMLEKYDDPIKGRNGALYVDPLHQEFQSKKAILLAEPGLESSLARVSSLCPPQTLVSSSPDPCPQPSQVRNLSLHQAGLRQEFLVNLASQCPQLEHLSLLNGWGFYPSSKFAVILGHVCPNLNRVEFRQQALDLQDEFFTSLCQQFPKMHSIHAGMTGFSHGALEAVRMQCKDLVSLNIDGARGIKSKSLDQLLRACGSLQVLSAQGVVLNGRDLLEGSLCGPRQWVCHGLETLVVDIEIYAAAQGSTSTASVETVRARVYDQLAGLTRLQHLGLGGGHRVAGTGAAGVDLTLESGLEALGSLHCLERLDIRRLIRSVGEQEMQWMVDHWPRLCRIEVNKRRVPAYSPHNQGGDKTNKGLEWLAMARPGIDICLS